MWLSERPPAGAKAKISVFLAPAKEKNIYMSCGLKEGAESCELWAHTAQPSSFIFFISFLAGWSAQPLLQFSPGNPQMIPNRMGIWIISTEAFGVPQMKALPVLGACFYCKGRKNWSLSKQFLHVNNAPFLKFRVGDIKRLKCTGTRGGNLQLLKGLWMYR